MPAVVGVPEIRPVEALIDKPGGSPEADHVYGGVPPLADICRLVAVPTVAVLLPGLVTDTPLGAPNSEYSSRFGVPLPGRFVTTFGVAALTRASRTCWGVPAVPCRYRAATPATCGVAIDVPLMVLVAVLLLIHAEVMPTPGAKMSTHVP